MDRSCSMEIRLGALRLYRQHLVAQYSDRCAFWSLRDLSSEVMAKTITIITDGADQDLELNYEKFWGVHMSTCTHTHIWYCSSDNQQLTAHIPFYVIF